MRTRYKVKTIAKATATSAAATTMTKMANICPSMVVELYREKATRLMLAEFRISSIPIKTLIAFLRVRIPRTPREKRAALMRR